MKHFGSLKAALMYALVAMTLFVCLPSAKAQTQDGSAEHPFLIQNKEQLIAFRNCVNGAQKYYFDTDNGILTITRPTHYIEIVATNSNVHYKLTTDIILNSGNVAGCDGVKGDLEEWEPIGKSGNPFYAQFDGGYHIVSGAFINKPTADNVGFFGMLTQGSSVKNLGVVNAYISGKGSVGGIVGNLVASSIRHCFVDATIVATSRFVGGIVGQAAVSTGTTNTIDTCYVAGSISCNSDHIGGICGGANATFITSCYSSAVVNYTATSQVGGILGVNTGSSVVENCYYDRQMCGANSAFGTGKLTNEMIQSYWQDLGSSFLYDYGSNDQYYPSLTGFSQTNYLVRLSTLPIILNGEQNMSDVRENFKVGGKNDGFTWVSSDNSVAEVTVSGLNYEVVVKKQGWFQLTGSYGAYTHTVAMYTTFGAVKGTEENPFTIDNQADLLLFRKGINSGTPFTYKHYTISARGANTCFLQTANITLPDVSWNGNNRIGTAADKSFGGIYDGGNFEVQGLKVTTGDYVGFFGYIQYGTVKNLGIRVKQFTPSGTCCGPLCGSIRGGTIDNCYVAPENASVELKLWSWSGGVVGHAIQDTVRILNTHNECNIRSGYLENNYCGQIGGILGGGESSNIPYLQISNCYNTGNIRGGLSNAAGVVGYIYLASSQNARIEHCYNTGNITNTSKSQVQIAGVLGYCNKSGNVVSYCYNTGDITGYYIVAGIAYAVSEAVVVDHCYNTGKISLFDSDQVWVGSAYGIAPYGNRYCLNLGEVSVPRSASAYGIGYYALHCMNAGTVIAGPGGTAYAVNASGGYSSNYNLNIGKVCGQYTYRGAIGTTALNFYDNQMSPLTWSNGNATSKKTSEMLGTSLQSVLGDDYWVYTEGMYPRIKGLENEDVSIVASSPLCLSGSQTVNEVSSNFTVNGCGSSVEWTKEGDLVTDIAACSGNAQTVTVADAPVAGMTILTVTRNGISKKVQLCYDVTPPVGSLNVTSLADLKTLRDGVNSGAPFDYNGTLVPAGAWKTTFKQTAPDIDLASETNWEPIGTSEAPFRGVYDGDDHTISHLTQSAITNAGLFGFTRVSKIKDLTLNEVNISNIYGSAGSIVGSAYYDTLINCSANGSVVGHQLGISMRNSSYVGGLVGRSATSYISNCSNFCSVTGGIRTYVGGIVGYGANVNEARNRITGCFNAGNITGKNYVGGLSGYNSRIFDSYNYGTVYGTSDAVMVGGVAAYCAHIENSFNTGNVTAEACAAGQNTYVGGIVAANTDNAYYQISQSYNTGIVEANNRKYVGGIVGYTYGRVTQCYNANAVNSTGEYVGSIIGYCIGTSATYSYNYYDNAFSQVGGVRGADVSGKAEAKTTAELTDGTLPTGYTAAKWTLAAGYYPRIASLDANDASYASAAKLQLPADETANAVSLNAVLTTGGCADEVTWGVESGNSIHFNNTDCTDTVVSRGVVYVQASKNGTVYKTIKLNAGVSVNSPLVIKSKAELIKFRNLVNEGTTFYYNMTDSTYSATDGGEYFAVTNQGADLYFKLLCDVDLSDAEWTPIGSTTHPFAGHFNGGNHTVTGMKLTSDGSTYGFIGYLNHGSIDSLAVQNSKISGTGSNCGFVCGINNTGIITHCSSTQDTIIATSGTCYGGICGENKGTIRDCFSTHDTIYSNSANRVGGICGAGRTGSVADCIVDALALNTASTSGQRCGGVVGMAYKNTIKNCQILNSKLEVGGAFVGGICGYDSLSDIKYCKTINTAITVNASVNYIGGIVGYYFTYNSADNPSSTCYTISCCETQGGSINAENSLYVGGIGGYAYYYLYGSFFGCKNTTPVKGKQYVGGIAGYARTMIDSCYNVARIEVGSGGYCGGISGYMDGDSWYVRRCINLGEVSSSTGNRVGGIVGYNYAANVSLCFNAGRVSGNDYVGGLCGYSTAYESNSYNVGQVYGGSFVGGICGAQYTSAYSNGVKNNLNVAHVQGNSITGAICGYRQDAVPCTYNFYDKQFSYSVGNNGVDVVGKAEGKLTSELIGSNLNSTWGTTYSYSNKTNNYNTGSSTISFDTWEYTEEHYPQLKLLHEKVWGADASEVTSTPITIPDTLTSWTLPSGEPRPTVIGGGYSSVVWCLEEASPALEIVEDTFKIKKAGVVEVAAAMHDSIYKRVRLHIGISEESPAVITDYNELCNFRNGINSGNKFYYDENAKKFHESQDAYFSYIEIAAGGEGMFFRLENNIDMALYEGVWTPIGDNVKPFKGNFNGNDKTIAGMVVDNSGGGNYHGLFGYSNGSIKNVTIVEPNVKGSNYTAALCGFNKGTILHCGVDGGTVTGSSDYTGGICGRSANGSISECYNSAAITGKGYVGGITGSIVGGVTQQCFNLGKATNSGDYTGGIAGYNSSYMNDCYNTGIISGVDKVGGINGYNEAGQFKRVYNAGYVEGTGTNVGGLTNSTNTSQFPTNSACDMRMAPSFGVVNAIDPNNQGKQTSEMTGNGMQGLLGDEYWTYSDSLYPRLKAFEEANASYASATPLFFQGAQTVLDLTSPFIAYNKNGVTWDYLVASTIVNLDEANAPASGQVVVVNCGKVSLTVGKGTAPMIKREIDLIVENVSAGELNDTTCGGSYVWALNGRTYSYSGDYIEPVEIGPGCNQITTLHLVVPEPLGFNMQSGDVVCYGNNDGYITPNVTGCFGTYTYEWSKAGDASFSSTASALTNLGPGKYYITVTDATKTSCKLTDSVVIAEPTELILSDDFADSHCYGDNDGELSFKIEGGITPYSITWTTPSAGSATQSLAGTYSMIALPDGTYDFTVKDANNCSKTMNILVDDYDTVHLITAYGIEKLYDGEEVNPNQYKLKIGSMTELTLPAGVNYTLGNGDILNVTVSQTTPLVNAGVTANNLTGITIMRGTEDVTCRYNIVQNNDFVRINKRNVTITSKSDEKVWDGTELVNRDTTLTGDGFADGEGVDITWDPEHSSQTNAGASYNQFTYALTSATNANNYIISPVFGMLTVTAEGTLIVSGVTVTKTYDGLPLQADYTVSGLKPGHHVEVSYAVDGIGVARPTITNVDTVVYDLLVGVFYDGTNENAASQYDSIARNKGTITINKLPITLTSNTKTKTYDGTELYDHDVTISGDDNNVFSSKIENLRASALTPVIDYTPTPVTNAITYSVLSGYVADNYDITKNEGTLSITKKTAYYTGEGSNEPYTGEEQCLTGITPSNLLSGHVLSGVTYSACGTNAGSYVGTFTGTPVVMNGSAVVTDNYELIPVTDTLTIQGSTAEIVISSASMTSEYYEGFAKTKQEYTVTYGGTNIAAVEGSDGKKFLLPTNDTIVITPTNDGVTGVLNVLATALTNDFDYAFAPAAHASNYQTPTTNKGTLNLLPRDVTLRSKTWTQDYTATPLRKDEVAILGMGFVGSEGIENPTWDYMDAHPCIDVRVDGENNIIGYDNIFGYTLKSNTTATNYNITVEYGILTINKLTLTVKADNKTRRYGDADPAFTYTMTGFVNSSENEEVLRDANKLTGTPILTTTATSTSPIGSNYEITLDLNDLAATNYNFYATDGRMAVTARQIHINALSVTVPYDGLVHTWEESPAPHYEIADPTELRTGDVISNIVLSGNARMAGSNPGGIHIESVTIMNGETDETSNYQLISANADLEITKRPLKIIVQDGTHVYDGSTHGADAISDPKYVVDPTDNLAATDEITHIDFTGGGVTTTNSPYEIGVNTSTLRIKHADLDAAYNMVDNYDITVVPGHVTITNNTAAVVITSATQNLAYNGTAQTKNEYTVTENGTDVPAIDGTNSLQFKLSTNDVITITPTFGGITNVDDVVANNNVFTYVLDNADQYSDVTTVYGTVGITPVELTVTADDKTRPYGAANVLTASYAGFVHSETEAVLTGAPELTCAATTASPIGDYDIVITVGTLAANHGNYTFSFVNGTLTVERKAVTITAADSSKTYDGTALTQARFTASALEAADSHTFTVEMADTSTITNAGTKANVIATVDGTAVTTGTATEVGNYLVTTDEGTLTVNRKEVTIMAADSSKMYDGNAMTQARFTASALETGDSHTFTVVMADTSTITNAGTKANVVATVDGVAIAGAQTEVGNYLVSTEAGTLTVTKRSVILTSGSESRLYDGLPLTKPEVTVSGDGFVTGEVSNIRAIGTITNIGSVPNTITFDTIPAYVAGNYNITKNEGTLEITGSAAPIVITSASGSWIYDGNDHAKAEYTVSYDGTDVTALAGSDGKWFVFPTSDTIKITPDASALVRNAGTYANNNTFTYTLDNNDAYFGPRDTVAGTLSISQRPVSVTANDYTVAYNGTVHTYAENTNPILTVEAEGTDRGLLAGHHLADTTMTGSGTNAGTYDIVITAVVFEDGSDVDVTSNYDVTFVPATLTITPAAATVTITGHTGEFDCDGSEHSVHGYDVEINDAPINIYSVSDFTFAPAADSTVTASTVGTYTMDLQGKFTNINTNYDPVTFIVTNGSMEIVDTVKPTFTVPADTTICRVAGEIVAPVSTAGDVTDESDNCATGLEATWTDLDTLPADNSGIRTIRREWTLVDEFGNTTKKIQNIKVRPSILTPGSVSFTCPDMTVTLKYGVCDTLVELNRTLVNNMSGTTVVLDSAGIPYGHRYSADLSPYTITWTVTDECGDYVEFTQTVTVNYPPCGGTIKTNADGDGIEYATVQVGCNCWMAENSRTTKYADGTDVTPAPMTYGTPVTTYGYLYNYYAATKTTPPTRSTRAAVADGQGICPDGWHIPDDEDFADLMSHYEAEDLMSDQHWLTPGTNVAGFGLEPAGMYNAELDRYEYLYVQTFLWSYEPGTTIYHACQFGSACGTIEVIPASAYNGFSVRCVRNTED